MFQTGYLTVKAIEWDSNGSADYYLKTPNREVRAVIATAMSAAEKQYTKPPWPWSAGTRYAFCASLYHDHDGPNQKGGLGMHQKIQLWEGGAPLYDAALTNEHNEGTSALTPYLLGGGAAGGGSSASGGKAGFGKAGCVIVFPGGGYRIRAAHEGKDIALWLNSIGVNAFVLDYRVLPYQYPVPMIDARRAVRHVRKHAEKYGVRPDKIGVLGFSAGGHLAGMMATHYADPCEGETADEVDAVSARPDCAVLCYGALSLRSFLHDGAMTELFREKPDEKLLSTLSCEENVTEDTPPTFLWHTADDEVVPVSNSLNMALALAKNSVPHAIHVFPSGRHGLGLAEGFEDVSEWTRLCGIWLKKLGFMVQ
jgi:acetyl esterase/lipase